MGELSELLKEAVFPEMLWRPLGPGSGISESVIVGYCVVAAILLFAAMVRIFAVPRFKIVPGGFQMFLEWLVRFFDGSALATTGSRFGKFLGPFTLGAAAYICVGILTELLGFRPLIADINACFALSLSTFLLINFCGLRAKGPVGRIKYYIKPNVVMAPIKLITDVAVPVSMALRLFASVLSGLLVMELIYNVFFDVILIKAIAGALSVVIAAPLSVIFTLFHAFMQSYIFATLTLAFISEATE